MIKKRVIWLVPVLVMALAMSACKSDDDGGGGIGETLSFQGEDVFNKDGSRYTGDRALTSNVGGSGTIRGGKLSFTVSTPDNMKSMTTLLLDMDTRFGFNIFSYASNDPTDTLAMDLVFTNLTKKILPTPTSTMEEIRYIWVNRDCLVKAPTTGIPPVTINGVSVKVSPFTLNLTKGWNAVSMIVVPAIPGSTLDSTLVIGIGDSDNCKWVFEK
jgi:hypothetical protein